MKINKTIKINEVEMENQFYLLLDFDQNNLPVLKLKQKNIPEFNTFDNISESEFEDIKKDILKINTNNILPISTEQVISILRKSTVSNFNLLNQISIVQNEAEEFVDFVETNSTEYKKLITANSFRTDKIKQGTLVKLQSGELFVFLQTIKQADMYSFERIFDHLDVNGNNSLQKKQIKNSFKTFNLFWNPVNNTFVLFNNSLSNKRVIECYDVVPEYNENNYSVKENYYKTLTTIVSLDELIFIKNRDDRTYFKVKGDKEELLFTRFWGRFYHVISFNSNDFKPLFKYLEFDRV